VKITRGPDGSAGGEGFDLIGAQMLAGFPQLCATLGATPEDLLSAAGIPCQAGTQGPARVTYRQFVDLLASASNRLGCLDFGMRLAIHQAGTDLYGPLGMIMRSARTFGDALQYVVEHAHVHSPAARITRHVIPGREGIVFSHEIIVGNFA